MKLEGLVEDVHLDEVLRVLAVSGRSGTLNVRGPEGGGFLILSKGRITAARVDGDRMTVGDALIAADLITDDALNELTDERRRQPIPQCFEDLMVVAPDLAEDSQRVLADRLKSLVLQLLGIPRGQFNFVVADKPQDVPCYLGDQSVSVEGGITAADLAADARKARHARAGTVTSTRIPAVTLPPAPTADVLLIDDDKAYLDELSKRMTERGVRVASYPSAAAGLDAMTSGQTAPHSVGVVDLVMPRADGRGILGGLDLIKRVKTHDPHARLILATDVDNADAVTRARELGVSLILHKPSDTNGDMTTFLDALLAAAGLSDKAGSVDLASELLSELGETAWRPNKKVPANSEMARALELLRDMVGPVNDPERRDEIPLMILRVASSTFSRAALFLVTDAEFIGLGGFGLDANGRDPGKALRDTHMPLDADTVLAAPLREKRSSRIPFFESEWNRYLAERLGGPIPEECYVAPVFCSKQVEAVLYCDNAVDRRALGDTQVLELFLTQAGAAMERASLEKRLAAQISALGGGP